MATSTSTFFLNISAIQALCQGASGITPPGLKYGYEAPTVTDGISGDFFFNIASLSSYQLYGPKTTTWPVSAITLTTLNYLTSYTNTQLNSLTGGGTLAVACLKDGGNSGYGLLSSLRILNQGDDAANTGSLKINTNSTAGMQRPHITCSAFGVENFILESDGSLTANQGIFNGGIIANPNYETEGGENRLYGGNIFGTMECFVSAQKVSISIGEATSAYNTNCLVGGGNSIATGQYSCALGWANQAIGQGTFITGLESRAVGNLSIVFGASAVGYHSGTLVWNGGQGADIVNEVLPVVYGRAGTSGHTQAVFYSASGTHIGRRLSVNNFQTQTFNITDPVRGTTETVILTVPITGSDATFTVNGTISGNNSITAPTYYDGNGAQLLMSRQTAPSRLTNGVSTSADIIAAFNLLLNSLTAHGLVR